MIAMAKGLKLQLIAEGVETEEQKEALIQMGCLYAQGYLYYKPMPAAEFQKILSNQYM
jgi:EAL domain-containing protein (putative c-di-GMP-specific phosphodiesterase class I)